MRKSVLVTSVIIFGVVVLILFFLMIYFGLIIGSYKLSWLFQGLIYIIIGTSQGIIGWTQLKQMRSKGKYISWLRQPFIMLGGGSISLGIGAEILFINSEYIEQQALIDPLAIFLFVLMIAVFVVAAVFLIFGIKNIASWRRKMLPSPKV